MSRIRSAGIGILLIFGLSLQGRQAGSASQGSANGVPRVQDQLRVLTKSLDLTIIQQEDIKPALRRLHDATEKLVADKSLTPGQRLEKIKPLRYEVYGKLRAILNDDQRKKLDQFGQEPHPEMHGSLTEPAD